MRDLNDTRGERAALEQAIKVDPNFALAQYELGYLDSREGDITGAEQRLRSAVEASEGYFQAWVALASILAAESRFSDALQAVDSALRIAPNDSGAIELRTKLIAAHAQR